MLSQNLAPLGLAQPHPQQFLLALQIDAQLPDTPPCCGCEPDLDVISQTDSQSRESARMTASKARGLLQSCTILLSQRCCTDQLDISVDDTVCSRTCLTSRDRLNTAGNSSPLAYQAMMHIKLCRPCGARPFLRLLRIRKLLLRSRGTAPPNSPSLLYLLRGVTACAVNAARAMASWLGRITHLLRQFPACSHWLQTTRFLHVGYRNPEPDPGP